MSHLEITHERDNEYPDDEMRLEQEMSPAEHWTKIVELAKAIELGAQDLQDQLREFNKSDTV